MDVLSSAVIGECGTYVLTTSGIYILARVTVCTLNESNDLLPCVLHCTVYCNLFHFTRPCVN